ncbi:MAG TPA: ABC transporter ATP-binding protein, partial [Candidatus Acidoferrum sp.]|nr:ABC transporter ATP-binding protein [Candidatus Acidoferrum sp.]
MLAVEGLEVGYGKVIVVWDVSFRVEDGEIVTIIGPNGAGKTTILRAVAGLLRPRSGRIAFRGREIGGLAAPAIATLGLALVPEGRELFPHMTVYENLQLGGRRAGRRVDARLQRVYTLFPRLAERARQLAATLSGGEQQMLAIGRALMSEPHLLLLDEPSTGLAPLVVEHLFQVIRQLGAEGVTTLLVEQNAHLALEVSDRAYVLERGRV